MENTIEIAAILENCFEHVARHASTLSWCMWTMTCKEYYAYVRYAKQKPHRYPQFNITEKAAAGGYPELMKFGLELGHPYSKKTISAAIRSGSDECFKALPDGVFSMKVDNGLKHAVIRGRLDLFRIIRGKTTSYIRSRIDYNRLFTVAIIHKQIEMMKYLDKYAGYLANDRATMIIAARTGDIDILFWMIRKSTNVHPAVYYGIILTFPADDVLRVLLEVFAMSKVKPSSSALAAAIAREIPDAIDWCESYGLVIDRGAALFAAQQGYTGVVADWFTTDPSPQDLFDVLQRALCADQLSVLKLFIDTGKYTCEKETVDLASIYGSIKILDYLSADPDIFDVGKICTTAYAYGPLPVLKYLHQNGYKVYPPENDSLSAKTIIWLLQNGVFDETAALCATASNYHYSVVFSIESDPLKWDDSVFDAIHAHPTRSYSMHDIAISGGAEHRLDEAAARAERK